MANLQDTLRNYEKERPIAHIVLLPRGKCAFNSNYERQQVYWRSYNRKTFDYAHQLIETRIKTQIDPLTEPF